jgi:hypothetical protein
VRRVVDDYTIVPIYGLLEGADDGVSPLATQTRMVPPTVWAGAPTRRTISLAVMLPSVAAMTAQGMKPKLAACR